MARTASKASARKGKAKAAPRRTPREDGGPDPQVPGAIGAMGAAPNDDPDNESGENVGGAAFPATPPDSGLRNRMSQPLDREVVRNPDKDNPNRMSNAPEIPINLKPTRPNRTLVEESIQEHHAPANIPFGSQPQNIDPQTGELIPMDAEERRTGVPAEEREEENEDA